MEHAGPRSPAGASDERGPAIATIVDLIEAGEIDLVINIPRGRGARSDGYEIRRAALRRGVPTMTNAAAAHAAVQAIANAPQEPGYRRHLPAGPAQPAWRPPRPTGGLWFLAGATVHAWRTHRDGCRVAGSCGGRTSLWEAMVRLTVEVPGWPGAAPGSSPCSSPSRRGAS